MPRRKPDRELPSDFDQALEAGVRAVLTNPKASSRDLVQAVQAGVQLQTLRKKHTGSDDDKTGSFWNTGGDK